MLLIKAERNVSLNAFYTMLISKKILQVKNFCELFLLDFSTAKCYKSGHNLVDHLLFKNLTLLFIIRLGKNIYYTQESFARKYIKGLKKRKVIKKKKTSSHRYPLNLEISIKEVVRNQPRTLKL